MATPEITMGNGGPSRRIACKLCRDRKVRCGGEQPVCEKCRRAGEQCVYLSTQKPSKADLAQTVEALQKRLDEAEAYIDHLKCSSGGTTITSLASPNFNSPANPENQNVLPAAPHSRPGLRSGGVSDALNDGHHSELLHQQQRLRSSGPEAHELPQTINQQQTPGIETDLPHFLMDESMNIDPSNIEFYPQNGFGFQRGISEETGAAILDPVTTFSSAIFRNQAEASVMASVVADYIAWLRKAPPGGGVPAAFESPVYLGMLDNLEIRLRELCEMSESRSSGALRELVTALEVLAPPGGAMAARLNSLEEDLQKEARKRAETFRARYNPCELLSQQSRDALQ